MNRSHKRKKKSISISLIVSILIFVAAACFFAWRTFFSSTNQSLKEDTTAKSGLITKPYTVSKEEKEYLKQKFAPLLQVNPETIAYIYAPGTQLDEPVVQTKDNSTYLDKTFEGETAPLLGAVFMDTDNKKDFSDQLTWLFAHARGSKVADHRMFNDVNFYDHQSYFDEHPYVVIETPKRKYYYEAVAMIIVPEDTAFYQTAFKSPQQFKEQLKKVYQIASVKNKKIKIRAEDKYLVLSTCREEDETIRSNLYLRQIPDTEMVKFLSKHQNSLRYLPTR